MVTRRCSARRPFQHPAGYVLKGQVAPCVNSPPCPAHSYRSGLFTNSRAVGGTRSVPPADTTVSPNSQNWLRNFQTSAGPQVFDDEPLSGNGVWSPTKEQNSTG
jgi:hypothetical protein